MDSEWMQFVPVAGTFLNYTNLTTPNDTRHYKVCPYKTGVRVAADVFIAYYFKDSNLKYLFIGDILVSCYFLIKPIEAQSAMQQNMDADEFRDPDKIRARKKTERRQKHDPFSATASDQMRNRNSNKKMNQENYERGAGIPPNNCDDNAAISKRSRKTVAGMTYGGRTYTGAYGTQPFHRRFGNSMKEQINLENKESS